MAISRQKKEDLVARYKEQIEGSSTLVFTNYRGTNVQKIRSLRHKLSESGVKYLIVKNTLLRLALEECGRPAPESLLNGPNGVAFIGEDVGRGVTALKDWIRAEKLMEITGALVETSALDAGGADALSDLPTKEQARAQLLGMLNSPASSLLRVLNAPAGSLARVLNAYAEKGKESAA